MQVKLRKSNQLHKKYQVTLFDQLGNEKKTIQFGSIGYDDYTTHHDEQRRLNYINRHQKREHWHDPHTAGFWSRWLLWEKPSIDGAKKNISALFGIQFV